MNRKIIKQVLKRKVKKWADSIEDNAVKTLCLENTIVTGGCIASMLIKEGINDFDIYFKNMETAYQVAKYYLKKFKETHPENDAVVVKENDRIKIYVPSEGVSKDDEAMPGDLEELLTIPEPLQNTNVKKTEKKVEETEDKNFIPVFITSNAITLSNKIQIVIRFQGNADEIHENFDYIHCTCSYDYWENDLVLPSMALESLLSKQLDYSGSLYPVCSIFRLRKFLKRGWHISGGQMLKMIFQASKLDLEDISVLEDQLIGVDTTYFKMLIGAIQKDKKNNSNLEIDSTYLGKLIDKIF